MEAFRAIKKPENGVVTVLLPDSLKDSEVEVIILPAEKKRNKKKALNSQKFKGIWKNSSIDVKKVCKEMREEWQRDI
ncbi:MAG: hypothetical protein JXB48_08035 [Candidatus Latescibacteria bacterium]|nr:hypothetical protein [Candidatus Latescibacterota bacterium]